MKVFEEISSYTALTVLSPCRYFSNTIVQDSVMGAFLFHVMNFLSLFFFIYYVSVCTYMCARVPLEARRERERELDLDLQLPEAGVIGYCELPNMGTRILPPNCRAISPG